MVDNDSNKPRERGDSGVSRRRFVEAVAATGITAGIAGCSGDGGSTPTDGGGGGGDGDGTPMGSPDSSDMSGEVVISGNGNLANNLDTQAFHEAGVPDSVTVTVTAGPEATGSRRSNFQAALNAEGRNPDLMMMDNGWTIPFMVREQIVNLSQEMSSDFIEDVRNNSIESMVRTATHPQSGDLYAVPYFPDFPTIQYRKDLFRDAGYGDSDFSEWQTNPPSWGDFSSLIAEVLDNSDVEHGYLWQGDNYGGLPCCSFNEMLVGSEGNYFGSRDNLFGPVGDRPVTLDTEEAINAVELGIDLVRGEGASPYDITACSPEAVYGWFEPDTYGAFIDDLNAVAERNWTYAIRGAADSWGDTDAELGVMPMPVGSLGNTVSALGGWLMTLNPHTNVMPAAKEVLKAIHSEEVQQATLEGPGFVPHNPDLLQNLEDNETYGPHFEALQTSANNTVPRPVTRVWPQESGPIATEVNAAFRGEKSPSQAMSDLQSQIENIENQAGG